MPDDAVVNREGIWLCVVARESTRVAAVHVDSYDGNASQLALTLWDTRFLE
ncbi:hypothetical protein UG55_1006188 [Frankia sp. EI5c]|uniref:hypothetical protein n=1 Tax=Frankia sp. EI5c TaxID=683316 RepID=UPI0007C282F1|nr:hypothetical protein [Frankia sp. EI5c]OAA28215.1 hypothetical protein UG55_1006188 [Frankia sp. EI5c]